MPAQKSDENWISNTLGNNSKHSCQQKISGILLCYCVLNNILFVVQHELHFLKLPGLHLCISPRQDGAGSAANVVINFLQYQNSRRSGQALRDILFLVFIDPGCFIFTVVSVSATRNSWL